MLAPSSQMNENIIFTTNETSEIEFIWKHGPLSKIACLPCD